MADRQKLVLSFLGHMGKLSTIFSTDGLLTRRGLRYSSYRGGDSLLGFSVQLLAQDGSEHGCFIDMARSVQQLARNTGVPATR